MPIGKDSISRVKNNGYSNIQKSAPDMQDSKIAEKKVNADKKPVSANSTNASPKKKAVASTVAKSAAPKTEPKPKAPKAESVTKATKTKKSNKVKIGEKLPPHLL